MEKKIAAVNFSSSYLLLDHIAPLAYILDIPLFVDDEKSFDLLKFFYPQVNSHLNENLSLQFLAKDFDTLISCNTWFTEDKFFLKNFYNKDINLIFCPHGNSDKGHINKANMLAYAMQDMVFLYGDHMKDLLKNLDVYKKLKKHVTIGNFRLEYYKKLKKFYDDIAEKKIFSKLSKNKKTILYAPTWKDLENSTSFFQILKKLTQNVSKDFNLIIKPHPNLEEKNPVEFYQSLPKDLPSNVLWLDNFPLIYPLLNKCDIYLGDFSSIGYDFLYFQRPMFFLDPFERDKKNPSLFLQNCGQKIDKENWNNIISFIQKNENSNFKEKQKKIYEYAFGKTFEIRALKRKILKNF
ncbi:MAG: hypothetical protein K940chlam5_00063 [Candidatus Anoxychlamydiales bacterium]|nr:hypothetical protein [Candidatus Anoxychlamydiales bacterium]